MSSYLECYSEQTILFSHWPFTCYIDIKTGTAAANAEGVAAVDDVVGA